MKNDPLEKKALESYREFLAAEVSRPEIEQQKRLFITKNFPSKPIWTRAAGVMVPAMAVFALFVLFQNGVISVPDFNKAQISDVKPVVSSADAPLVTAEAPSRIEVASPKKLKKIAVKVPPVMVKRATSQVGQPMVYQRKVNEKPITVVWVFTGAGIKS